MARDVVAEILELKQRRDERGSALERLRDLRTTWEVCRTDFETLADFFPMRAVTLLEVFVRAWLATLIDHGSPFTERAEALVKAGNIKLDLAVFHAVRNSRITLGELIAHSVSVNGLGDVERWFSNLLGGSFFDAIEQTHDRADVEIFGKPKVPIIPDLRKTRAQLVQLYTVRHIVTHELPATSPYSIEDIADMLQSAVDVSAATDQTLLSLLYGDYPIRTLDMQERAREEWADAERTLEETYERVEKVVPNTEVLGRAREAWRRYRETQAELRASIVEGGSYFNVVYANELKRLTDEQVTKLSWWLNRKEGEVF